MGQGRPQFTTSVIWQLLRIVNQVIFINERGCTMQVTKSISVILLTILFLVVGRSLLYAGDTSSSNMTSIKPATPRLLKECEQTGVTRSVKQDIRQKRNFPMDESIPVMSLAMVLLLSCKGSRGPKKDPVPDDMMTKWGPKLSEEKLAAISKLSTTELVDMLKTGDTLHKFAALERLKANGAWKKNFDLLLNIAAEKGGSSDMIVEGLVSGIEESASAEDKCLVDNFLDFLEAELKKDKPSVSRHQAIRSIGQAVTKRRAVPTPARTKLEILKHMKPPYGHGRAISILISCLYSKHWRVRADAIDALGSVGAQDIARSNHIIATLETQLAKEETSEENKADKEGLKKTIEHALRRLRGQLRGPKQVEYE